MGLQVISHLIDWVSSCLLIQIISFATNLVLSGKELFMKTKALSDMAKYHLTQANLFQVVTTANKMIKPSLK